MAYFLFKSARYNYKQSRHEHTYVSNSETLRVQLVSPHDVHSELTGAKLT
eukprot:m.1118369 g.1118369  ORF g.1118369 m.1118369 type:complete len:50 (-) comp24385_c0_seq3:1027-1176(-)